MDAITIAVAVVAIVEFVLLSVVSAYYVQTDEELTDVKNQLSTTTWLLEQAKWDLINGQQATKNEEKDYHE